MNITSNTALLPLDCSGDDAYAVGTPTSTSAEESGTVCDDNEGVSMSPECTKSRSFAWLNATQFFGALNDNVFRWLVVFFLRGMPQNIGQAWVVPFITFIFVLPFLLFSHAAGVLADRYSKRTIIVLSKWLELIIMALGCVGIYYESAPLLYVVVFLMSTQSTIFGPSKYGIVPELVGHDRLSMANGLLTGLSYLAIIIGIFMPSYILTEIEGSKYIWMALFCLVIAAIGICTCMQIEKTPAVASGKQFSLNFFGKIFGTLFDLGKDRDLLMAVLGSIYFLFLGGFIQQNLVHYGMDELHLADTRAGYLFPAAALGIGLGALLAGKLSGRNIEFGIVPIGALILTVCCAILAFMKPTVATPGMSTGEFFSSIPGILVVIFMIGIGGGLFIVPLNAFIQYKSPKDRLGEILACVSFFTFLGVALSAGVIFAISSPKLLGFSPRYCFLVCACFTFILALLAIKTLPDFLVRFVVLMVTRTIYRIRAKGLDNVPVSGGALLVCNHVTWVDTLLLSATTRRRIRFMMARDIYDAMWIKPLFKLMQVIPISPKDPPRQVVASLKEARAAIEDGYLVCIFAEGALTRNGNMHSLKPGLEHIVKGTEFPIIPIHLGGAWGSIFSYYYGKLMGTTPKKIPHDVSVLYGEPMPPSSSTAEIRQAIRLLSVQAVDLKKNAKRTLPYQFIRTARRAWHRQAVADTMGKRLSFGHTLTGAIALGREIESIAGDAEKIGVLLPSSVGGAITNIGITLLGRVPVNLNFTASTDSIASAIKQCEITTIISSQAFLAKLEGFQVPEGTVYLEDIMPRITGGKKFAAMLTALFAPTGAIMRFRKPGPDDLATVIFSSGSTGEPKGVMLSHHSLISNIESMRDVAHFDHRDSICAVLPFFHSFGFSVTLWCPMLTGFLAYYHPNPIDGNKIAEITREERLTVLLSTPTFLLAYIRRAKKEDFESLRLVVVGAEKLKKKVADTFKERFGIRPLEAYGATELAPGVSLNVPDKDIDGALQIGTKEGSVGHPLPGVVVKVVDPDTGKALPPGSEGMLMVKGPNVMTGYLGNPEKTAEVLKDGWYETGDIGRIDDDGFIFILDRMSRYSKIGGEMVPHIAIEEKLMQALAAINPVVFVTAAPDEKRGEQLVVLFTPEASEANTLIEIMKDCDLPNLWKPRKDNYLKIETMPTLGSGKLDLKRLKAIAKEFCENKPGIMKRAVNKIREAL